jgi:ElaB/YqjD/DUF883 family membrane-anchored ribosome-binding protein
VRIDFKARLAETDMADDTKTGTTTRVQGLAERAHGYVDQARNGAATGADQAAQVAHRSIDQAATGATAAADWVSQKTGDYTRAPQAALESACATIRERPLLSVGIALAAGYVIGRIAR